MKTVLAFFLFYFPVVLSAQTFGDNNAEWVYDFRGFNSGVTKIKKDRDTIVDNRTINIFRKIACRENSGGELIIFDLRPLYIRQEGGIIEFSENLMSFDTLFNFNLKIGESWTIPERNFISGEPTGSTLERTVLDTFHITINDSPMFCQTAKAPQNSFVDTIFQDIGSGLSFILPFDGQTIADSDEGGFLRCFKNDRVGVIDFQSTLMYRCPQCLLSDFEYSCDQLSSLGETPTRNSTFSVFPNPVSNTLHIQSDTEQITQVDIYNLNGQLILHEQSDHVSKEMDLDNLSPGMYYILINEKYFEKVVVVE